MPTVAPVMYALGVTVNSLFRMRWIFQKSVLASMNYEEFKIQYHDYYHRIV